MRFSLLLMALGVILKRASRKNQAFMHFVRNTSVRVLIKTEDGRRARLFVFEKGVVTSEAGDHDGFDVALVWKDARTAYKVMLDKRPDASFRAAADNKIKVVGTSIYAKWFEDAMKLVI